MQMSVWLLVLGFLTFGVVACAHDHSMDNTQAAPAAGYENTQTGGGPSGQYQYGAPTGSMYNGSMTTPNSSGTPSSGMPGSYNGTGTNNGTYENTQTPPTTNQNPNGTMNSGTPYGGQSGSSGAPY